MKLSDYLIKEGLNASQLAAQIDVPPSTITRILAGARRPSWHIAKKISDATGGEVARPEDFAINEPDKNS